MTTPLAQELIRDVLHGDAKSWPEGFAEDLMRAKCFECSGIVEVSRHLAPAMDTRGLLFLPARTTWLEHLIARVPGHRQGYLLSERNGSLVLWGSARRGNKWMAPMLIGTVELGDDGESWTAVSHTDQFATMVNGDNSSLDPETEFLRVAGILLGLLAFINTPKIVAQQEHAPHKGLDRELRRAGKPGLRPWTEIKLEISRPRTASEGGGTETLRGSRALHYCRTHLRVRLGRLERVTGHFRGDAKNGVVRADYKVVA